MLSYVLNVFCGLKVLEYFIPKVAEGETLIELKSEDTGLESDIKFTLDSLDGQWKIISKSSARFNENGKYLNEKLFNAGDTVPVFSQDNKKSLVLLVDKLDSGAASYSKFICNNLQQISIGRSSDNIIFYKHPLVSSNHAVIVFERDRVQLYDAESQNGTFVNGEKINSKELSFGDSIFILGLKVIFLGNIIAINNPRGLITCSLPKYMSHDEIAANFDLVDEGFDDDSFFQRSPRIVKKIEKSKVDIDTPPSPNTPKKQPLFMTLGPSITMGMAMLGSTAFTVFSSRNNPAMMIPGIVMSASMLLGTIFWPLLSLRYHKKSAEKDEEQRKVKYREYLNRENAELQKKVERNRAILSDIYPDPEVCLNRALSSDRRLWERTTSHDDFLDVRLGKGIQPFSIDINIQKERFTMVNDPLQEDLKKLANDFKLISNVPISVSFLKNRMVGMIGDREKLVDIISCMIVSLAALHSYDELKMVFVYDKSEEHIWNWVKWLPHVWSAERNIRFIATQTDEVREAFLYLEDTFRSRIEEDTNRQEQEVKVPYYLVFVMNKRLIENEYFTKYITNSKNNLGISSVFLYEKMNQLPKECNSIIQYVGSECYLYNKEDPSGKMVGIRADSVANRDLNAYSRSLAQIKVKEDSQTASLPNMLTFLGMYGVGRIENLDIHRRWKESTSYKTLEAPLGVRAGGSIFNMNIHEKYHGPHGLIAGMTGSGKSEFIQSFILSMAINYHPSDVSFILIDYKGGGMANCFKELPHIAGIISNLGGNQIRRSLISLQSELKRRQRVFAEVGVNHIDKYQQLYKEHKATLPLPHLVIISDEFAELKSQQPEFMKELVSAARIGRSLGVHLILATQKPSGVVDDQIWSNTKFRICLKVLDRMDSNEMLKRPEAADLTQPGRCFVQVGNNEIFELIQSGWSGAAYMPSDEFDDENNKIVSMIDNCARPLKIQSFGKTASKDCASQLSSVVEFINKLALAESISPLQLWLEPLPEVMALDKIRSTNEGWNGKRWMKTREWMNPVVGIIDDPKNQSQVPLGLNLGKEGHLALYGAPGTGKTTFLQTFITSLVMGYTPDMLNIYILDFGGRTMAYYQELPHVGGVIFSTDEDKLNKLIKMLTKELENRKRMFSDYGVGSLSSYMEASGKTMPAIVLILDNYSAFNELYPDLENSMVYFSREGGNYGIYLVLTGNSTNSIKYRVIQNFKLMLTLQLNDKYDYTNVVGQTNGLEPEAIKGRGLVKENGIPLEFQTAIANCNETESGRVQKLKELFKQMAEAWDGRKAKPIPVVPDDLTFNTLFENAEIQAEVEKELLPLGYDVTEAEITYHDIRSSLFYNILGYEKTGKTNLIKVIHGMVKRKLDWKTFVVDCESDDLKSTSVKHGAEGYIADSDGLDEFTKSLYEEVNSRFKDLKSFRLENQNPETEYEYMQKYNPIVVLIDGFEKFYDVMSHAALANMVSIAKNGANLSIYFIITGNPNTLTKYSNEELYRLIFSSSNGFILGGRVDSQSIFNVNMNYNQRSAQLEPGYGYMIERQKYKTVKIPLV